MRKINAFVVLATADNIAKMSKDEIQLLAETIFETKNAKTLSFFISNFQQDKDYLNIEIQEPA